MTSSEKISALKKKQRMMIVLQAPISFMLTGAYSLMPRNKIAEYNIKRYFSLAVISSVNNFESLLFRKKVGGNHCLDSFS